MSPEKVWAIVEVDYGVDGKGKPFDVVKKIFDCKLDAEDALFKPYIVRELEIDTKQTLLDLSAKLTEIQKYSIECYNETGIKNYLINGRDAE
jgi:hypothetical protein